MGFSLGKIRLFGFAVLAAASMNMASAADKSDVNANYQRERAACNSIQSSTDRAACLREAAAARDAARKGQLGNTSGSYETNALARCKSLPAADDQAACERRVRGEGTITGSVDSGGIYRELVVPDTASQGGSTLNSTGNSASSSTIDVPTVPSSGVK